MKSSIGSHLVGKLYGALAERQAVRQVMETTDLARVQPVMRRLTRAERRHAELLKTVQVLVK